MNLYNFMNEIDETILNRGLRYFKDGHVLGTKVLSNGWVEVLVVGHDDYTVSVQLADDGTIFQRSSIFRCLDDHQIGDFEFRGHTAGADDHRRVPKEIGRDIRLDQRLDEHGHIDNDDGEHQQAQDQSDDIQCLVSCCAAIAFAHKWIPPLR